MTLPNFLIIGAHKAGTTSLHRYLQQHPEVFLPVLKEARYFSYNPGEPPAPTSPFAWGERIHPVKTWEQYQRLFAAVATETAVGEASPCYLNNPHAPLRISETLPGVRLIASLRDPVDRAYSGYLMAVRNGQETRPFVDILRERTDWHATLAYYEPCRRWLGCFPRNRLMFIRAETLQAQPAAVLEDIFSYLGVDPGFAVDTSVQFNAGGMPRSNRLHRILTGRYVKVLRPFVPDTLRGMLRPLKRANLRRAPRLSAEQRADLIDLLRDHILRLQDLLQIDVSDWLEVERRAQPQPQVSRVAVAGEARFE